MNNDNRFRSQYEPDFAQAIQSWVEIGGRNYTLMFTPEYDGDFYGYYNASVAEVPGCFSYGQGLMQAEERIIRALESHLGTPVMGMDEVFVTVPNFDDELIPPGTLANIANSVGLTLDELLTIAEHEQHDDRWDDFVAEPDVDLAA